MTNKSNFFTSFVLPAALTEIGPFLIQKLVLCKVTRAPTFLSLWITPITLELTLQSLP